MSAAEKIEVCNLKRMQELRRLRVANENTGRLLRAMLQGTKNLLKVFRSAK